MFVVAVLWGLFFLSVYLDAKSRDKPKETPDTWPEIWLILLDDD